MIILNIFLYTLIFFLGASIASFICVNIGREHFRSTLNFSKGKEQNMKRSFCESCKKQLFWYELIPVISYILQFGKCSNKNCKSKIPISLFISEILLGVFFVNLFFFPLYPRENPIGLIFFIFIGICMFYLSYQDYLYQEIESWKLYLFATFGFISNISFYIFEGSSRMENSFFIVISSIFLYIFFISYTHLGKDKFMGQGDFLVLLGLLFFYGLESFVNIFVYSIWMGAIVSVVYLYKKYGKFQRGETLPFIPFLFLGLLFFHITQYKLFIFKDIIEVIKFIF